MPEQIVLQFRAAGEWLGVLAEQAEAVFERPRLRPVPGAPSALLGVEDFRGRVLAVVDLGALMSPRAPLGPPWTIVALTGRCAHLGIAVAPPVDIVRLDADQIRERSGSAPGPAGWVTRTGVGAEGVLGLLHPEAVLARCEELLGATASRPEGPR